MEANPAHVKALLYRRGMANLEVGDFEEARGDFGMVMPVVDFSEELQTLWHPLSEYASGC